MAKRLKKNKNDVIPIGVNRVRSRTQIQSHNFYGYIGDEGKEYHGETSYLIRFHFNGGKYTSADLLKQQIYVLDGHIPQHWIKSNED